MKVWLCLCADPKKKLKKSKSLEQEQLHRISSSTEGVLRNMCMLLHSSKNLLIINSVS